MREPIEEEVRPAPANPALYVVHERSPSGPGDDPVEWIP
jgi:hypothetical protein